MPKTVYNTATTINGFLADENDSLSWLFEVNQKDDGDGFARFLEGIGAMCMGSTTYEWVLREEKLLETPDRWQEFYGARPTWVFTHRQLPAIPGADIRFVSGDVGPVHDEMVAAAGDRDVWIAGGGELVGLFADQGRLDELRFSVAPVMLAGGAPLLPRRLAASRLELVSVNRNGQFAELTYRVTNA